MADLLNTDPLETAFEGGADRGRTGGGRYEEPTHVGVCQRCGLAVPDPIVWLVREGKVLTGRLRDTRPDSSNSWPCFRRWEI